MSNMFDSPKKPNSSASKNAWLEDKRAFPLEIVRLFRGTFVHFGAGTLPETNSKST